MTLCLVMQSVASIVAALKRRSESRTQCHEMHSHEKDRLHMKTFVGHVNWIEREAERKEWQRHCQDSHAWGASVPRTWYARIDELESRPFLLLHHLIPILEHIHPLHYYDQLYLTPSSSFSTTPHAKPQQQQHNVPRRLYAFLCHSTALLQY